MTEQLVQVRWVRRWITVASGPEGDYGKFGERILQIRHRLLYIGSTGTVHLQVGEQWGEWEDISTHDFNATQLGD